MRTSPIFRYAILVTAAAASLACDDKHPVATQIPTGPASVPANALSAYMRVSNPRPSAGDRITVTVRALRGQGVGEIGSFTLRLAYDSTSLRLLETGKSQYGMVMANGDTRGEIRAAGASGQGFTDDQLLVATFLVTGARAIPSLKLDVSELNSIKFEDQRAAMRVDQNIYRAPIQ